MKLKTLTSRMSTNKQLQQNKPCKTENLQSPENGMNKRKATWTPTKLTRTRTRTLQTVMNRADERGVENRRKCWMKARKTH